MGLFSKKDKNSVCKFSHLDGLSNVKKDFTVKVTQNDELQQLEFEQVLPKTDPLFLKYFQVCKVGIVTEKEIEERDKSVVGRAVIGGLLLGPIGAVVGGTSGVGTKKETKIKNCLVINYHPTNDINEIKVILLEIVGATMHLSAFIKALKEKANIVESKSQYL